MDNEIRIVVKIVAKAVVAMIAVFLFFGSWFVIGPGQVGVTFSRISGQTAAHSQGIHLKLPILTGVVKFDAKTQRLDMQTDAASKDIQKVSAHVALNYHLAYDKVNDLYIQVGQDYAEKVIAPAVEETVKAATAQFPAEEIIVRRADLKNMVEENLKIRLAKYNLIQESLNLVNIDFSPEFNKVVEEKQIEEQKIKTAEYQKRQAEEFKQKTILEAQAESEKQRLMRQTITTDLVALEWIKKWNGQLPQTVLNDKSVMMVQPK